MILLRLISWPYARRHLLRTVLTTAGIVLGVTVFVGMHTANQGMLIAFSETIDRIAGRTDLQVTAGDAGFGEEVLETVQEARGVRVAVPVIEAIVESGLEGEGTLLVLGVDMTGDRSLREHDLESGEEAIVDDPLMFLAQPDSLIVAKELADRHDLSVGSRLTLGTAEGDTTFVVRGIMRPAGLATAFGGNLAVMDVYAAQKMFGRGRTFDRIDLAVTPDATPAEVEGELATRLGPGFTIQPPAGRGRQAEAMLAGYSLMVGLSSAFALFIGMFIIYNSFAVAVTQRRSEIGILRALGATRSQIRWLFLGESAIMGLVGSLAGLAIGLSIARAIGAAMGGLAGDLYGVTQQTMEVTTDPTVLAAAAAIGIGTSLVAAAIPARHAARVDPVQALGKGRHQLLSTGESRRRAVLAAACGIVSAACLATAGSRPVFYAGYALAVAAVLLLGPALVLLLSKAVRPILTWCRPVEGALAADSLIQAPRRTSASVSALMLSLALIVAFAGMARATRGSVLDWMDTTLNPDLFVMPSPRLDLRTMRFPASMGEEIAAVPGVERVQRFRNGRITFRGRPAMVAAVEMSSLADTVRQAPIAGDATDMYRRAAAGESVILSDNLAQLHDLGLEDVIEIAAPYGTIRLPVAGIIMDYTDQQGTIFVDRHVFTEHWRDDSVSDFRIFVAAGADVSEIRRRIIERYSGQRQIFVMTNDEARRYVLAVADRWFDLMNVQIAIAVLVAVLGIVNTLTVSVTDRRRELGVLQAIGALRGQVRRTIWMEACLVAILGLILGCAFGAVNLHYILEIVRRDVAGLRLEYQFPVATAALLIPIMLTTALVAAIWPAESAVRGALVEALGDE